MKRPPATQNIVKHHKPQKVKQCKFFTLILFNVAVLLKYVWISKKCKQLELFILLYLLRLYSRITYKCKKLEAWGATTASDAKHRQPT